MGNIIQNNLFFVLHKNKSNIYKKILITTVQMFSVGNMFWLFKKSIFIL